MITIFDLKEAHDDELKEADNAIIGLAFEVEPLGEVNLIEGFAVTSGEAIYIVHRFENWVHCTCPAFKFGRICKHIAATFPPLCIACRSRAADKRGGYCQDHAPWVKVGSTRKPSMIVGGIRI